MKFGILGDLHISNRTPERRKDDFLEAVKQKLVQAFDFFESKNCGCVFQVGDFFNAPTVANRVKSEIMKLLSGYSMRIFSIWGQHDISGHSSSTYPNSPLAVLESAGFVKVLGSESIGIETQKFAEKNRIFAFGASFGQEVPKPEFPEAFNILVIHEMIGNRPLWPGQPLVNPRSFLRNHPFYNIVLCGDYHYAFSDRLKGQLILNPGALMRKNLTDLKFDHQPSVCVIDSETLEVETKVLEVADSNLIFDMEQLTTGRDSEALNRFVEELRVIHQTEDNRKKPTWEMILNKVLKEKKVSKEVQEVLDCAVKEVDENVRK